MDTTTTNTSPPAKHRIARKLLSPVLGWMGVLESSSTLVLLLLASLLISGMAVVYTTHQHRLVFHELQQLRGERNELEVTWGQLLIEQSTFGLDNRIERLAADELGMQLPDWSRMVMVRHEQSPFNAGHWLARDAGVGLSCVGPGGGALEADDPVPG